MSISAIGGSGGFDVSKMASKIVKDLDANGDGSIDKAEFTKGMAAKGMSADEASKKFDSVDTKKTGKITQSDIEKDLKNNAPKGHPPSGGAGKSGGASSNSSTTYDVKDTNKDGKVSAMEELVYEIKNAAKSSSKTSDFSASASAKQKIGSVVDVTV
jgi:EF hand